MRPLAKRLPPGGVAARDSGEAAPGGGESDNAYGRYPAAS